MSSPDSSLDCHRCGPLRPTSSNARTHCGTRRRTGAGRAVSGNRALCPGRERHAVVGRGAAAHNETGRPPRQSEDSGGQGRYQGRPQDIQPLDPRTALGPGLPPPLPAPSGPPPARGRALRRPPSPASRVLGVSEDDRREERPASTQVRCFSVGARLTAPVLTPVHPTFAGDTVRT